MDADGRPVSTSGATEAARALSTHRWRAGGLIAALLAAVATTVGAAAFPWQDLASAAGHGPVLSGVEVGVGAVAAASALAVVPGLAAWGLSARSGGLATAAGLVAAAVGGLAVLVHPFGTASGTGTRVGPVVAAVAGVGLVVAGALTGRVASAAGVLRHGDGRHDGDVISRTVAALLAVGVAIPLLTVVVPWDALDWAPLSPPVHGFRAQYGAVVVLAALAAVPGPLVWGRTGRVGGATAGFGAAVAASALLWIGGVRAIALTGAASVAGAAEWLALGGGCCLVAAGVLMGRRDG
ncbi:MAG: hypothetical protein ABEJ42_09425 [Halobacteriaceae archaeon]